MKMTSLIIPVLKQRPSTKKSISAVCGFPLEMMNETRDDGFGTTSSISNCNDPTYDVLLSVPIYLSNIFYLLAAITQKVSSSTVAPVVALLVLLLLLLLLLHWSVSDTYEWRNNRLRSNQPPPPLPVTSITMMMIMRVVLTILVR